MIKEKISIINGIRIYIIIVIPSIMDEFDIKILNVLKNNSDMPLKDIGKTIGLYSPSAVSRRINEMKKSGIIKKNIALIDYEKLGYDFMTIVFIKTKYKKDYAHNVGERLKRLDNVVAIYFILGDIDFVMLTINKNREAYLRTMEALTAMEEIERSDSRIIGYTIKDIDFGSINIK